MSDSPMVLDCVMREVLCAICGKDAACIGCYEDMEHDDPACNECCGHGGEDGHCEQFTDEDGEFTEAAKTRVAAWMRDRPLKPTSGDPETPW